MMHIQDKLYELLKELDEICNKVGIHYCLFGRTACEAFHIGRFALKEYEASIAMRIDEYFLLEKYIASSGKKNRCIEVLTMNEKFPYLYAKYVDESTLYWNSSKAGRVKCPAIGVNIYILIPYPLKKIKRRFLIFIKEGLYISKNKNSYDYKRGRKVYGKLMSFFCFFQNKAVTKFAFKYTGKYDDGFSKYYLMDCGKRRIFISREYMENLSEINLGDNSYKIPVEMNQYIDFLQKYYSWNKYESTSLKLNNNLIISTDVSYKEYLEKVMDIVKIEKYEKYKRSISRSERKQHANIREIRKAYRRYLRTIDYYKLADYYSNSKIKIIYNKWEKNDIESLDKILKFYVNVANKYRKSNLPIGYKCDLYNLVIKYVTCKGMFSLSEYLLKNRKEAYRYIKDMEKIGKNKEVFYD